MNEITGFLASHWLLVLALLVVLVLIFVNEALTKAGQAKALSPAELISLMNEDAVHLVDIRDADSFKAGHIINAVRIAPSDLTGARLEKLKNKPLVLVCVRGQTALTLANALRKGEHPQAMILAGGMTAWTAENLPLIKRN